MRQRIALGVLNNAEALEKALRGLSGLGIDVAALTIVAGAAALDGGLSGLTAEGGALGVQHPTLIMRDHVENGRTEGEPPKTDITRFETWAPRDLSRNLDDHLAAGDVVLVVPVAVNDLEGPISEILLETATDRVQIHDIRFSESSV